MIKSQPEHMAIQGSFRHVRVSIAAEIAAETFCVGMLGETDPTSQTLVSFRKRVVEQALSKTNPLQNF
jgi:hypothetical protein